MLVSLPIQLPIFKRGAPEHVIFCFLLEWKVQALGPACRERIWQRKILSPHPTNHEAWVTAYSLDIKLAPSLKTHIWCPAASHFRVRDLAFLLSSTTYIPSPPHRSLMGAICLELRCTLFTMENSSQTSAIDNWMSALLNFSGHRAKPFGSHISPYVL